MLHRAGVSWACLAVLVEQACMMSGATHQWYTGINLAEAALQVAAEDDALVSHSTVHTNLASSDAEPA